MTEKLGRDLRRNLRRDRLLYLMLIPGLVYVLMFKYAPMYGVTIAFRNYSVFKGFADAPFVGLANFAKLFSRSAFTRALGNSSAISLLNSAGAGPGRWRRPSSSSPTSSPGS